MKNTNANYDEIIKGNDALITFFMPTYNRAKFIPRIYDNLQRQTLKNFVWLIVNDGSQDNTNDVCIGYVNENKLPICYISKENGGKHSAFKVALDNCETKYFICIDDDDVYSEYSTEFFVEKWKEIENQNNSSRIGAIRSSTKRHDGKFVTNFTVIENEEYDATTLDTNYIMKRRQENWTCYKTDALRSVDLFPENYWMCNHHTFFIESIWQGRFARKYLCRYINTSLCTYTDDAETSLIRHKKDKQHYWNSFLNHKFLVDEQSDYMSRNVFQYIKTILRINIYRNYLGVGMLDFLHHTKKGNLKFLYILTWPLSKLSPLFHLPKS